MRAIWILPLALTFSGGCEPRREQPPPAQAGITSLPSKYFQTLGTISLQENADVINVSPSVSARPGGSGFLVVDQREARARLYRDDGRLLRQFGRKGRGPGEFQRPIAGYELRGGHLLIADLANGLLQFASPDSLLSAAHPPLMPIYGVVPLSDSVALLAGRGTGTAPALLHVWNVSRGAPVRSFFTTPGDSIQRIAARNFGWAGAAVRGDTIAAVFALADTLYLFDLAGTRLRAIPLRIAGFRSMHELPGPAADDPVRLGRWLEQFVFLNSVFPLPDGTFLVQSERQRGTESEWNLLRVDTDGRTSFDLRNTPRLLAVRGDRLYFADPAAEAPNRWIVARLRER
jgi:hypothetical protein